MGDEAMRSARLMEAVDVSQLGWYEEDDAYVYHVTSAPNAARIVAAGFAPGNSMFTGGAYKTYSRGRAFFTERSGIKFWMARVEDQLFDKCDDPPDVAVIRIPKSAVEHVLQPDELGTTDSRHGSWFVGMVELQSIWEGCCTILVDDGELRPRFNSLCEPIAQSDESLLRFWRWFGNSKMVDDYGRPLVLYHGTRTQFEAFEPSRGGEYGSGIYFTDDRNTALMYASRAGGNGVERIVACYLALRQPFAVDAYERDVVRGMGVKKLQNLGHDGVSAKGLTGERQYIVFCTEQAQRIDAFFERTPQPESSVGFRP